MSLARRAGWMVPAERVVRRLLVRSLHTHKIRRGRSRIGSGGADVGGIQACSSFLMDLCWFAMRARRSFKEAS